MAWQSGSTKRKKTGGKRKPYREKRKFEQGRHPVETKLGETKKKIVLGRSRIANVKLVSADSVNVTDPRTGKTEKLGIVTVVRNPANIDYNRRGILTKGTIVRTEKGLAKITSSPGQDGVLNGVVYTEET